MSLIIKGMKMPCMCCVCPCHDWDMEANRYYCQALKDEPRIIDENTRRDDCPLIEIPTPHGRLIDADALQAEADSQPCFWKGVIDELMVSEAPTIIEAEVSE